MHRDEGDDIIAIENYRHGRIFGMIFRRYVSTAQNEELWKVSWVLPVGYAPPVSSVHRNESLLGERVQIKGRTLKVALQKTKLNLEISS